MKKFKSFKKHYQEALLKLEEILKLKSSEIVRDSAIKRFEVVFDLSWKVIKAFLEEQKGISCFSPKDCFREAFKQGLIDYDELWLKMTDWRNLTVHTYSEKFANDLYKKLPKILKCFKVLNKRLEEYE